MFGAFAALTLAACRNDCAPAVVGATEGEHALVSEAAWLFLDRLVPSLEVCVPTIRIVDELPDDLAGQYHTQSRRIELLRDPSHRTVHHELCHAAQMQNDVPTDGPRWTLTPEELATLDHPNRHEGDEAFAEACELALSTSFLLGPECPDDPPNTVTLYETRDLFTGPGDLVDLDRQGTFYATATVVGEGAFTVELADDSVVLRFDDGVVAIDPWTGALASAASARPLEAPHVAFTALETLELFALVTPDGSTPRRRVWIREGRLSSLGCVEQDEVVFTFDGWLWSAWRDGDAIVLGYWLVR